MTNVTAIVSPSARPSPSMMPPMTPIRVYGSTTLRTTSHVVQPRPYADSFSTGGTISNTSRITDAMNGITMTDRMTPAVSTPSPVRRTLEQRADEPDIPERSRCSSGCT